jgi:hypothetical protein
MEARRIARRVASTENNVCNEGRRADEIGGEQHRAGPVGIWPKRLHVTDSEPKGQCGERDDLSSSDLLAARYSGHAANTFAAIGPAGKPVVAEGASDACGGQACHTDACRAWLVIPARAVIASRERSVAAEQSRAPRRRLDCFAPLAMTPGWCLPLFFTECRLRARRSPARRRCRAGCAGPGCWCAGRNGGRTFRTGATAGRWLCPAPPCGSPR